MRVRSLALSFVLAMPLALSAQTATPAQPQPGTVPVTNETPAATNGVSTAGLPPTGSTSQGPAPGAAVGNMTKKERKAERKVQRKNEEAADKQAKAAKSNAKAMKAQDKATDATQRAQPQQ